CGVSVVRDRGHLDPGRGIPGGPHFGPSWNSHAGRVRALNDAGRVAPVERLAIGNPGGPAATVGRCFLDRTDRCAEFLGRGPRYRLALDESPFWYRDCS